MAENVGFRHGRANSISAILAIDQGLENTDYTYRDESTWGIPRAIPGEKAVLALADAPALIYDVRKSLHGVFVYLHADQHMNTDITQIEAIVRDKIPRGVLEFLDEEQDDPAEAAEWNLNSAEFLSWSDLVLNLDLNLDETRETRELCIEEGNQDNVTEFAEPTEIPTTVLAMEISWERDEHSNSESNVVQENQSEAIPIPDFSQLLDPSDDEYDAIDFQLQALQSKPWKASKIDTTDIDPSDDEYDTESQLPPPVSKPSKEKTRSDSGVGTGETEEDKADEKATECKQTPPASEIDTTKIGSTQASTTDCDRTLPDFSQTMTGGITDPTKLTVDQHRSRQRYPNMDATYVKTK